MTMLYKHDPGTQAVLDDDHLRLLKISHYVVGGLSVLGATQFLLFPLISVIYSSGHPANAHHTEVYVIGALFVLGFLGWLFGGLTIYAGRCLAARKKRKLIMTMAGLNCLNMPIGTALGIFTFNVLMRPSVIQQFAAGKPGALLFGAPAPALSHVDASAHALADPDEDMWKQLEAQAAQNLAALDAGAAQNMAALDDAQKLKGTKEEQV